MNQQLDKVLAAAYAESQNYFEDASGFRVNENGELMSDTGVMYVRLSSGVDREDVKSLESAEQVKAPVFTARGDSDEAFYEVTDEFIKCLSELES